MNGGKQRAYLLYNSVSADMSYNFEINHALSLSARLMGLGE